jgi:hypothetical protein
MSPWRRQKGWTKSGMGEAWRGWGHLVFRGIVAVCVTILTVRYVSIRIALL